MSDYTGLSDKRSEIWCDRKTQANLNHELLGPWVYKSFANLGLRKPGLFVAKAIDELDFSLTRYVLE